MFPFELVSQLSALAMRQNPREDTRVGHKFMPIGSITPCTRVCTCAGCISSMRLVTAVAIEKEESLCTIHASQALSA